MLGVEEIESPVPVPELLTHAQIANAALCLLLAVHWLSAKTRRPWPLRILGANYLLYASQSLMLVARLQGAAAWLGFLRPVFALLLAPALYAYFLTLRRPDSRLKATDAWHGLPAILALVGMMIGSPLLAWLDSAVLASYALYLGWIIVQLHQGSALFAHLGDFAAIAHRWLTMLCVLMSINLLLEIAVYFEILRGVAPAQSNALLVASLLFLMINGVAVLFALRRSPWLQWMHELGERTLSEEPAELPDDAARQLFERWTALIESESLYTLEFGITVSQAAKKLQVPARQLSNAVNQVFGQSFSVHLNDRRIQEAKKLLVQQPRLSIVDVMLGSGFSSKSSFNKEFLRVTGMSPSQFREGAIADS